MNSSAFFVDLLQTVAERGREFLSRVRHGEGSARDTLSAACETLLSSRGEASGVALARQILDRWESLDENGQLDFLKELAAQFGPDFERLDRTIAAYLDDKTPASAAHLHNAAEARRQELVRRLNLAPGAIRTLVLMRELLLRQEREHPELGPVDADFLHLFSSWFNRGFLVLRPIDWSTPANILEKIIKYEAVHAIHDWEDLRRRLEPADRRCFAFFHPQLADDPLIFVEIALTQNIPSAIADLLHEDRIPIAAGEATTAVFYSISNCQQGLRGVSFGNFLIKQVVDELRRDLPLLQHFVTLSPVPGFAAWLARERTADISEFLTSEDKATLSELDATNWPGNPSDTLRKAFLAAAAEYFLVARTANGKSIDPVARFHLGNGARLERLNFLGDLSSRALKQAYGLMVNYSYRLDDIERNHEQFVSKGRVAASPEVRRLLRSGRDQRNSEMSPVQAHAVAVDKIVSQKHRKQAS
jgi:malonyl-CoA decarboxylase